MARNTNTFKYKAVHPTDTDASGRRVFLTGEMQAPSEDVVRTTLTVERGLLPVSVEEKSQFGQAQWSLSKLTGTPSGKSLAHAFRQLASLVKNKVSLPEAIAAVAEGSDELMIRETFGELRAKVLEGVPVDEAMAEYPKVFDDVVIQLVRAAVAGGFVPETLQRIATMVESKNMVKKKIRGAVMLPAITVAAAMGVGILISIVLIPSLAEMLYDMNPDAELPAATRALMSFSSNAIWVLPLLTALVVGLLVANKKVFNRKEGWLRFKSKLALKVMVFGRLTRLSALSTLSRGIDMMLSAGVRQSEALKILAPTMKNRLYRESVSEMAKATVEGRRLSEVMVNYPDLYDFSFRKMVETGEKAGALDEMMSNVADQMEFDLEDMTDNLANALNPLAIVVVGVILGALGMAMFSPILTIANSL